MSLAPALKAHLDDLVSTHPVVLFMKGDRSQPQCGFSASVIDVLNRHLSDYQTIDVLREPDIREGIKEYSDWPTIPQLYVAGEFVGGADIVTQMDRDGDLSTMLKETDGMRKGDPALPPVESADDLTITLTDAAAAAMIEAREEGDPETLRISISASFQHELFFDAPTDDDFSIGQGDLQLVIAKAQAPRARDLKIDFLEQDGATGFKIDNPNRKKLELGNQARDELLDAPALRAEPPEFTVTDVALSQFDAALKDETDDIAGVQVSARRMGKDRCEYTLDIITTQEIPSDAFKIQVHGIDFFVDQLSAANLHGATINFVDGDAGAGFKFENDRIKEGWEDARADRFEQLLEEEINPSVAAHGGVVQLLDLQGDTAYVLMGGGCQGCGMAGATLNEGVAERVKQIIPSIRRLIDSTDHAAGENPYYKQA